MAKWKDGPLGSYICSYCECQLSDETPYMFWHIPDGYRLLDYCPCCGNKMDGEEDDMEE